MLKICLMMVTAVFFSGCGSELKLSMKAADAEKDQPSTALVRKVDLSYRDPAGAEKLRQSIPVIGLSQPISVKSDLTKDLKVEPGGAFEARAYSAEGLLLLKGDAPVNEEDSNSIEVVLSREASQATVLSSVLLRKIRITGASGLARFELDAGKLRGSIDSGACVVLPPIPIEPETGVFPGILIESAIKAPSLRFDAGRFDDKKNFSAWGEPGSIPLNANADAWIELGHEFFKGILLKGEQNFVIRLYSNQYEGCLSVNTVFRRLAPTVTFGFESAYSKPFPKGVPSNWPVAPVASYTVQNHNAVPLWVRVSGSAIDLSTYDVLGAEYDFTNTEREVGRLPVPNRAIVASLLIPPRSSKQVFIYGVVRPLGGTLPGFADRGFRLQMGFAVDSAASGIDESFTVQTRIDEIR